MESPRRDIVGIRGICDALRGIGLYYSESWVQWACSSTFPGRPIPVRRRGWGPKGRIWIPAEDLLEWAKAFRLGDQKSQ